MRLNINIIFYCIAFFIGCASTPRIIPEMQFGWVLIGASDGNLIIIPNMDKIPAYNIYRKSANDTSFIFITKEKHPPLPMRNKVTQYSIEWIDEGNTAPVRYKVMGLKDDGTEWFEVKLEYRVPKEK